MKSLFLRLFIPVGIIMLVCLFGLVAAVSNILGDLEGADKVVSLTIYAGLTALLFVCIAMYWTYQKFIGRKLADFSAALKDIAEGEGDLTKRLITTGQDEISLIAQDFNQFMESLQNTIQQIMQATQDLSTTAQELQNITQKTSDAIHMQEQGTQQVAQAVTDMASQSTEVSEYANNASNATKQADGAAYNGNTVLQTSISSVNKLTTNVSSASEIVDQLQSDSNNIGGVLEVIQGIAEQTNLLALNAAIEAARAGEQGRGFAVVADEVRTLAARTQDSTHEIQQMIERLQSASKRASAAMQDNNRQAQEAIAQIEQSGSILGKIQESVSTITNMNSQIAASASQQQRAVSTINDNVSRISQMSEETSQASQQTQQHSKGLSSVAEQLQTLVGTFKV